MILAAEVTAGDETGNVPDVGRVGGCTLHSLPNEAAYHRGQAGPALGSPGFEEAILFFFEGHLRACHACHSSLLAGPRSSDFGSRGLQSDDILHHMSPCLEVVRWMVSAALNGAGSPAAGTDVWGRLDAVIDPRLDCPPSATPRRLSCESPRGEHDPGSLRHLETVITEGNISHVQGPARRICLPCLEGRSLAPTRARLSGWALRLEVGP